MTFKALQQTLGKKLKRNQWVQHKNGGGWVRVEYKLPKSVCVDETSIVGNHETNNSARGRITGKASIEIGSKISGTAIIEAGENGLIAIKKSTIKNNASITGNCYIYNSVIGGSSNISDNARVSNSTVSGGYISGSASVSNAQIEAGFSLNRSYVTGGDWNSTPVVVDTPRGWVAINSKPGFIRIGCKELPIERCLDKHFFNEMCDLYYLTPEDVKVYRALIKFYAAIDKK